MRRLLSELPLIELGNGIKVEIADIVALCRKAGNAIMQVYRQPEAGWGVQYKEGNEPLTKADLQSNQVLFSSLFCLKKIICFIKSKGFVKRSNIYIYKMYIYIFRLKIYIYI